MHKKILVLDHSLVFLGSANLTTSSLRHHANLVLGVYHPELGSFLENSQAKSFSFALHKQQGEIFLLPDPERLGFQKLMAWIEKAKKKINIAMFTLTHPQICDALIAAQKRGVDVTIVIDYYTGRGASKKAVSSMEKEGIHTYFSQGKQLLHHKWAVIDGKKLIMGSANWTKAAFAKNQDFLLFLERLTKKQRHYFKNLWNVIECEAVEMKEAI